MNEATKGLIAALIFCLCVASFETGCPDPQTGKIDPYLTAHTIINQAQASLALADGIFNQWLLVQTDQEKAKKTKDSYDKVRTAVANGLVVAHNAVDLAKQAKEDPDIVKILAQANAAWESLVKLLSDLLGTGSGGITVELAEAPPAATQPVADVKKAVKAAKPPISYLPKSLIPGR